ncbi:Thioredoxin-like protein 4A [Hibiscus syriacus]|uniref:Thioredoxin-like protein 4A n=1 Tax=Hibiscus syriacus TaxID=106335 RepID=A0A6A3AQN8_HIBSY|nr:thioredoxin-like protein YLS8 [Hibiscus syriacus]KAE8706228.1 Thioredoxin-like protein 4A [Hibiscus syriacus]
MTFPEPSLVTIAINKNFIEIRTEYDSADGGIPILSQKGYACASRNQIRGIIRYVDITEVPDFNTMYELYDPSTVMFFFRNKHIMIDLGTGNNNKINWALKDKQEFIDIVETVYRGARKGRGLVIAPKDYSTKYRY